MEAADTSTAELRAALPAAAKGPSASPPAPSPPPPPSGAADRGAPQQLPLDPSSDGSAVAGDVEAAAAGPGPGAAAAPPGGSPPPKQPRALQEEQQQRRARRVILRVEVASTAQARLITWSMWTLNILFVLTAAGLLSMRETDVRVGDLRPYYLAELIIGSVSLAILVAMLIWFLTSIRRSRQDGRVWTKRQGYFTRTAAMLLGLQIPYSATFVGAFVAVLTRPDCQYPWRVLAVLEFVQWMFFSSLMLFLLARLQNMTVWRGKGALDMHPDYRLMVDRPAHEILRNHRVILTLWVVLMSASLGGMIDKLLRYSTEGNLEFEQGCDTLLDNWEECGTSVSQTTVAVISFVLILVYVVFWIRWMLRALKDHGQLPYSHYRSTLIFVRVLLRVVSPVLLAVVASVLFLTLIPSFRDSCWAAVDGQMGNLPVDMALTVSTVVMVILYMPKAKALDSPLLQEFLQGFSWTLDGMPAAIEERNELLLETEAPPSSDSQTGVTLMMSHLHEELAQVLARLRGVPDIQQAAEQLRQEPMFCIETAIKLFYWMRLAYRHSDALTNLYVNAHTGLRLFSVDHFETIWDDTTDTHAVLGWNKTQVVVAFRGTKSIQNVMTDLKTWMSPLQPRRRRQGRLVKVHAGFNGAWVHSGFNRKVLDRLKELDQGPTPLRFWIVGHSLGGALAALAALEIQREHPNSQLTCYTFGCPRVGNHAFAEEFDAAVPDTWAVINGLDPIPWVPGDMFGFRRVGKRVTINAKGDLMLRPSYFEMSVTHGGTSARHHLAGSYALSLAAILKAQFVPSKTQPGGAEGVERLAAAVDLGKALVLSNMDLESLQSKERAPEMLEVLAARAARKNVQAMRGVSGVAGKVGRSAVAAGRGTLGCGLLPCCRGAADSSSSSEGDSDSEAEQAAGQQMKTQWRQQERRRWRRRRQYMDPDTGEGSAAPGPAQPAHRIKSRKESLHTQRYPTFKLDAAELGNLGEGPGGQPAAAEDASAAPEQQQPAADGRQHQAPPLWRRSSLGSVEGLRECSMHSALSHPEQLPDLEL